ncbi:hypothetical protein GJ496_001296 [Pomphorhynchus laevis]|nr:hypothetical protein GJ496_001296 [Pomphorhynchus laevis]
METANKVSSLSTVIDLLKQLHLSNTIDEAQELLNTIRETINDDKNIIITESNENVNLVHECPSVFTSPFDCFSFMSMACQLTNNLEPLLNIHNSMKPCNSVAIRGLLDEVIPKFLHSMNVRQALPIWQKIAKILRECQCNNPPPYQLRHICMHHIGTVVSHNPSNSTRKLIRFLLSMLITHSAIPMHYKLMHRKWLVV